VGGEYFQTAFWGGGGRGASTFKLLPVKGVGPKVLSTYKLPVSLSDGERDKKYILPTSGGTVGFSHTSCLKETADNIWPVPSTENGIKMYFQPENCLYKVHFPHLSCHTEMGGKMYFLTSFL
jgi:hypothetical protein